MKCTGKNLSYKNDLAIFYFVRGAVFLVPDGRHVAKALTCMLRGSAEAIIYGPILRFFGVSILQLNSGPCVSGIRWD